MSGAQSCQIHPTAIVSPEAELGEGVVIGPMALVEGKVKIGAGCVIKGRAHLCGPLTLGCGNIVFSGAILGEQPQHLKFAGEPTSVLIGNHNTFRENVTIHRGTSVTGTTIVGDHNYLMAGSHVAHDCVVGNRCILANNALLGGHCVLGDNVFLSGNSAVHQFCRVGRLSLLSGCGTTSKDIPPFVIQHDFNVVVGVNVVGLRRAGFSSVQINGIRRAFHILFRDRLPLAQALIQAEAELGQIDTVRELIEFVRTAPRGVSLAKSRRHNLAA